MKPGTHGLLLRRERIGCLDLRCACLRLHPRIDPPFAHGLEGTSFEIRRGGRERVRPGVYRWISAGLGLPKLFHGGRPLVCRLSLPCLPWRCAHKRERKHERGHMAVRD